MANAYIGGRALNRGMHMGFDMGTRERIGP
jgi:hypothetical protein